MIKSFQGKTPQVAASAFVSEIACIIGNVEIGENSNIWPGAVIRGDNARIKIGRNTSIQDNCVIHADQELTIGDNVIIGHGAIIHCRRIGSNVLIGVNAIFLDGAEVGDYCVIGAGSLIAQGKKLPDRSLAFGAPAQIKGEPSPEQLASIEDGVKVYVELAREHKQQGL